MRKVVVIGIILGGFIVLGLKSGLSKNAIPITVEVEDVKVGNITTTILASGELVFKEHIKLRSEILGTVEDVRVAEADRVSEGDIVLTIDPGRLNKEVEQFKAAVEQSEVSARRQALVLEQLKRQLHRQQELFDKGLIGKESFEMAQTEVELALLELSEKQAGTNQLKAQLAQVNEQLAKTIIRAPRDGIVTEVNVKKGESVIAGVTNVPGSVLLSIADPSQVLTEVHVDETDIAKIKIGQYTDIFAVAYPNEPFQGHVESIAIVASESPRGRGRGFKVKVLLDDTAGRVVKPGISCRAEIHHHSAQHAITIPLRSVIYDVKEVGGSTSKDHEVAYVFVNEDGRAVKRKIDLSISNDTYQAVKNGLDVGEQIITGPYKELHQLQDGREISVQNTAIKSENS